MNTRRESLVGHVKTNVDLSDGKTVCANTTRINGEIKVQNTSSCVSSGRRRIRFYLNKFQKKKIYVRRRIAGNTLNLFNSKTAVYAMTVREYYFTIRIR